MKPKLLEIDSLRGIAALVVAFFFHQHYLLGTYRSEPMADWPGLSTLYIHGWVMVDLFFAISGFIFAHVYLGTSGMTAKPGEFVRARIARLYPLHLLTLVVAALVFRIGNPASVDYATNDAWHFGLNLVMLQESGLNAGSSFNLPTWSISVEVMCYAVFYLVAVRLPRHLTAISAVIAGVALIATLSSHPGIDHIARGFCGFFAGVVAYRHRSANPDSIALVGLIGLGLILLPAELNLGAILGLTIFPVLVIAAPRIAWLRHRALAWLGDRSYSIYLIHAPLYMAVNVIAFSGQPVTTAWTWPTLLGAWLAVLLLSDASFRWFETPVRRWIIRPPRQTGSAAPTGWTAATTKD